MRQYGRKRIIDSARSIEAQFRRERQPWTDYERATLTASMLVQCQEAADDDAWVRESMQFGVDRGDFSQKVADRVLRCLGI